MKFLSTRYNQNCKTCFTFYAVARFFDARLQISGKCGGWFPTLHDALIHEATIITENESEHQSNQRMCALPPWAGIAKLNLTFLASTELEPPLSAAWSIHHINQQPGLVVFCTLGQFHLFLLPSSLPAQKL